MTDRPPKDGIVYLDSNILIYWIERADHFTQAIRIFFAECASAGCSLVTSELTLAECLYKPEREGDRRLVSLFEIALAPGGDIRLLEVSGPLVIRAARRGGSLGLKLLDAIHYLSAIEAGANLFVTADSAFQSTADLTVLRID